MSVQFYNDRLDWSTVYDGDDPTTMYVDCSVTNAVALLAMLDIPFDNEYGLAGMVEATDLRARIAFAQAVLAVQPEMDSAVQATDFQGDHPIWGQAHVHDCGRRAGYFTEKLGLLDVIACGAEEHVIWS